jgi:glycylpeptide N-tetradecanoyltransferase
LKELYIFLNENYVEDKDAMFRFDYQPEFLQWALQVPHYHPEWILAVRGGKNDALFGFISGIPVTL